MQRGGQAGAGCAAAAAGDSNAPSAWSGWRRPCCGGRVSGACSERRSRGAGGWGRCEGGMLPVTLQLFHQPPAVLQVGVERLHRLDDFLHFLLLSALQILVKCVRRGGGCTGERMHQIERTRVSGSREKGGFDEQVVREQRLVKNVMICTR